MDAKDMVGVFSSTAESNRSIKVFEIVASTIRWVCLCLSIVAVCRIVMDSWATVNLSVVWWQSPLVAVAIIALFAMTYVIYLSVMLVSVGKQPQKLGRANFDLNRKWEAAEAWRSKPDPIGLPIKSQPESSHSQPQPAPIYQDKESLELGSFSYKLRKITRLQIRHNGDVWTAQLTGLSSPLFEGIGATADEAAQQLHFIIHRELQCLLLLGPGQLDAEAAARWLELEAIIDVDTYRRSRLVSFYVKGRVLSICAESLTFQWIGGDVVKLSADLLRDRWFELKVDDYFEAVLWRNVNEAVTFARADFVRLVPKSNPLTPEKRKEWIERLPPSELPARESNSV